MCHFSGHGLRTFERLNLACNQEGLLLFQRHQNVFEGPEFIQLHIFGRLFVEPFFCFTSTFIALFVGIVSNVGSNAFKVFFTLPTGR